MSLVMRMVSKVHAKGRDSSNEDSDDEPPENITLAVAVAVAKYPNLAVRALAQYLGLKYERMERRMITWERDRARRKQHLVRIYLREKRKREFSWTGERRGTIGNNFEAPSKFRRGDQKAGYSTMQRESTTRLPLRYLIGPSHSN